MAGVALPLDARRPGLETPMYKMIDRIPFVPAGAVLVACLMPSAGAVATDSKQQPGSQTGARYAAREEKSIMVPMRDGVLLSTDLYFPDDDPLPLPTILVRTPYGKSPARNRIHIPTFVGEGYVVAIQDMRGRFESEGRYRPATGDRNDSYDTLSWIAEQPWSNDKVATYGCSYRGDAQVVAAATRHPSHVAAIPEASTTGYYAPGRPWVSYDGGAFELAQTAGWFSASGNKLFYGPPPWIDRQEWFRSDAAKLFRVQPRNRRTDLAALWKLPVIDILKQNGSAPSDYEDFVSNHPEASFFKQLDWVRETDRFDVPAIFIDAWYDYGVAETLALFNLFRENSESDRSRDNQFVIIAPTTHCGWTPTRGTTNSAGEWILVEESDAPEHTIAGERDMGDARLDFFDIYLRWFERWLKDVDNGITDMPKVQYYLMGKNEWRSADRWPLPDTDYRKFYLHSAGGANSRYGDGSLSGAPPGEQPADHFVYDPATPVPTLGGQACCTGMQTGAGGFDQSTIEIRNDVLVYTSPALGEGLDVTGQLEAVLYVSSSAKDTDFTAKLVDVYPDGRAFNVQEAAQRMRYRDGFANKVWMQEGQVYEIHLDLHATANYFGPGHRIRLEISSSSFPRWDRNLNTGGNNYDETEWVVAENTVHHSTVYPSHLILPLIDR